MKILLLMILILAASACVQTPTKSTQVVDDRPRVAFDPVAVQSDLSDYQVIIDGINYGSIQQFLVDENTLPVVSGRHVVEIVRNGKTVSREELYLGVNTTRVIKVVDRQ